jgi:hypothetical protein
MSWGVKSFAVKRKLFRLSFYTRSFPETAQWGVDYIQTPD